MRGIFLVTLLLAHISLCAQDSVEFQHGLVLSLNLGQSLPTGTYAGEDGAGSTFATPGIAASFEVLMPFSGYGGIVATGGYFKNGFDESRLSTTFRSIIHQYPTMVWACPNHGKRIISGAAFSQVSRYKRYGWTLNWQQR